MPSVLPHSSVIRAQSESYADELRGALDNHVSSRSATSDARSVYKVTLAADSVLARLATRRARPRLATHRAALRRTLPVFLAGQLEPARLVLRQLIELVFWTVYFSEHPVEWASFEANPVQGMKDAGPISHAAHREPAFYRAYAKERFGGEPSGLAESAANELAREYGNLSMVVHAGPRSLIRGLGLALEEPASNELGGFRKVHRSICASTCIVLCASNKAQFDRLPPVHRAWFDWLIGTTRSKVLRSGPFGL